MFQCTKCKAEVPEGSNFCPSCGSSSIKEVIESTPEQKIKGRKMGIVFGAILALLLIYCVFSFVSGLSGALTVG